MLDKKLFVGTDDGSLFEFLVNEKKWVSHGRPDGKKVATAPGAAMLNKKLFVGTDDGYLFEHYWNDKHMKWEWVNHGLTKGDLSAYDWCYYQSGNDITFYPIVKNEGPIDWESAKKGYYEIGIEVEGGIISPQRHTLDVWPYWSLKKGETNKLQGITLPFYKKDKVYFMKGTIWVLHHPEDTKPGNNQYQADKKHTYLHGEDFLENGIMYGKRCKGQ